MKYTLLLPVLSYASAMNSSRKHTNCIKRCNELPFKVAAKARRADCISSCGPSPSATVDSNTVVPDVNRDETCVDKCYAMNGSRRYTNACIQRCPESSGSEEQVKTDLHSDKTSQEKEMTEVDLQEIPEEMPIDTESDATTIMFDPVTYLPLEELGATSNSTVEDTLQNATAIDHSNTTDNAKTSDNVEIDSISEIQQNKTVLSNETVSNNQSNESKIEINETDAVSNVSGLNTSVVESASNSMVESAVPSPNETSDSSEPMLKNDDAFAAVQSDEGVVPSHKETHDSNQTMLDTDTVVAVAKSNETANVGNSSAEINAPSHNETSEVNEYVVATNTVIDIQNNEGLELKESKASLDSVPSVAPGTVSSSYPEVFGSNQNDTRSDDFASPNDDSAHQECVDKCNKKRTLQRKRDACLERCNAEKDNKTSQNDENPLNSYSATSLLSRGYGSAKYEL